jgi:hypothetical protein
MEYVDDVAIKASCDRHRLNLTARLEPLIEVCEAGTTPTARGSCIAI